MPKASAKFDPNAARGTKSKAKRRRKRRWVMGALPDFQNRDQCEQFFRTLYSEFTKLNDRVEELELITKNLKVDPTTTAVTFPNI